MSRHFYYQFSEARELAEPSRKQPWMAQLTGTNREGDVTHHAFAWHDGRSPLSFGSISGAAQRALRDGRCCVLSSAMFGPFSSDADRLVGVGSFTRCGSERVPARRACVYICVRNYCRSTHVGFQIPSFDDQRRKWPPWLHQSGHVRALTPYMESVERK